MLFNASIGRDAVLQDEYCMYACLNILCCCVSADQQGFPASVAVASSRNSFACVIAETLGVYMRRLVPFARLQTVNASQLQ